MTGKFFVPFAAILFILGCSKEIGDPCETSVDCDIQNKRICDLNQPGGYCTIRGCEKGTCPEEAVCVMFRPEPERLSSSWCMYSCDDDDDCRDKYSCLTADQLGEIQNVYSLEEDAGTDAEVLSLAAPLARNLDKKSAKFCTVKPVNLEN
ncbi:MAG: hypothetical protein JXA30_03470 [Deltaproteobacteria bacterium]|nr:hypothetical protein [Deltaproteobacteria bacterium]